MIRKSMFVLLALALSGTTMAAGDPSAGREKSQSCQACHGADGNADNPMYPRLAGQYETYLLHALKGYKSGDRNNAIMTGMVAGLSEQDMADLAAFYAEQKGLYNTLID